MKGLEALLGVESLVTLRCRSIPTGGGAGGGGVAGRPIDAANDGCRPIMAAAGAASALYGAAADGGASSSVDAYSDIKAISDFASLKLFRLALVCENGEVSLTM